VDTSAEHGWRAFGPVAAWTAAAAACALIIGPGPFARFLGGVPGLPAMLGAGLVAGVCLWSLSRCGFRPAGDGVLTGALAALPFAAVVTVADVLLRFPEDLNVPWPAALAFYPAIALVAEAIFHLLPLALILAVLRGRAVALALVLTALVEPLYQARGLFMGEGLTPQNAFVLPFVLAFNLVQLWLFRRHGFLAMAAMRLANYAWWHLAWGALRLELLF